MFRDIPIPPGAVHLRVQVSPAAAAQLARLAAEKRISIAAFTRLAVELIAAGKSEKMVELVYDEVERVRGEKPVPPPEPPKPRGRPRKLAAPASSNDTPQKRGRKPGQKPAKKGES